VSFPYRHHACFFCKHSIYTSSAGSDVSASRFWDGNRTRDRLQDDEDQQSCKLIMLYLFCMTNSSPFSFSFSYYLLFQSPINFLCISSHHHKVFCSHETSGETWLSLLVSNPFLYVAIASQKKISWISSSLVSVQLTAKAGIWMNVDEWRYSKQSMTPLTRLHGHMLPTNSSLRLIQDDV
jgi:hypothetical protein